jgi:hypothetical protein
VSLKAMSDLIMPNTSIDISVCTFPVLGSGRSSSSDLPLETMISWLLVPLKFPCTAWVIADDLCRVKLYRYIVASVAAHLQD